MNKIDYEIYADSSFNQTISTAGLAIVALESGIVKSILIEVVKVNCATEAECKAVDAAIKLGFATNKKAFRVLSDCKSAIDALNGVIMFRKPHLKDATEKIAKLTEWGEIDVQYKWIPRHKNKAHEFARAAIVSKAETFGLIGIEKNIYQYMAAKEKSMIADINNN